MSSSSPAPFDPYCEWLGISPREQPADYYRLLGLDRFECDPQRIEAAADERMNLVRKHQTGPRGILTQPLLNELAAARNCLIDVEAKREYDERLRQLANRAPLARLVASGAGMAAGLPLKEPPLPTATDPHSLAEDGLGEEPQGTSLGTLLAIFVGMAAMVVVVAAGTYAAGRYSWLRPEIVQRPVVPTPTTKEPAEEKQRPIRRPPASGKSAVIVMQEGSRDVNLTAATAMLHGGVVLTSAGSDERLNGWSNEGDEAVWNFKLLDPGFFQVQITFAATDDAGETQLTAILDDQQIAAFELRPTGALDKWGTREHTVAIAQAGEHTLTIRLDASVAPGSLSIKQVRLIAVATAP